MSRKLRFELPWEGEKGGSSRVAWKFAVHELKAHIRIFTLIILIMAVVTTPFSLSLSFNYYLDTVVKTSIEDSVSSDITLAYPRSIVIDEVAHGSSSIMHDAQKRAELLREKGLNASVRHVCFENVALPGGITHQAEIWGIDTKNDSKVCSLEEYLIEGEWFDPNVRYVTERESESFIDKLIQDMLPESQWIQMGVIIFASIPHINVLWYNITYPMIGRVFDQATAMLFLAPYPLSLFAGSVDSVKDAMLPSRVTHPENFLASMLETLSPRLANILPILAMLEEIEQDAERLNLPTSVVFWVKLEEYADAISQDFPLVGKVINNVVTPIMDRLTAAFKIETKYPLVVGKSFADNWGIEVNDTILLMPEFTGRSGGISGFVSAEVIGIYDTGLSELERWRFYMPLESVAEMKGYRDEEGVEILVRGEETEERGILAIFGKSEEEGLNALEISRDIFDDVAIFTWEDYVEIVYGSFVTLVLPLTMIIMIITLVSALAAIASIMDSIARRRTKEIGYLKAYGLRNRGAINIVLYQALMMGLIAGVVGIGLFIGGIYFMEEYLMISIGLNPLYIVTVGLIPIITSILGALAPGIRIARLQPVIALREGEMQM
ncbi:MAG TPA: ABC transporter permease [Thermoplasmata archaeon]|nr:ABC transporter permease [Thermoplasmata archaeon]